MGFVFFRTTVSGSVRLVLVALFYVGMISVLEGMMSFYVFYAAKGAYDLYEKLGPVSMSKIRSDEPDEGKRAERRKA